MSTGPSDDVKAKTIGELPQGVRQGSPETRELDSESHVTPKSDSSNGSSPSGSHGSGTDTDSDPNDQGRQTRRSANQTLVIKSKLLVESKDLAANIISGDQPEYELRSILGEGGMGVVYDARQTSIDRIVAVKMIKGEAAQSTKRNEKFLAEAVVTGDLDHPNIVPIYDVGTNSEGNLFYSMKKVQGVPWMDVIADKSLAENLDILMRTADAVGFAHARGIVHRDLKPENIMLGEFGEVLVMDWGLAHPMAGYRKSNSIASSKSMGGTPAYMSPEMVTGPLERIGPASDIYLLGAILYEIVTGHPPHMAKTAAKCLELAARNKIAPTDKTGELIDIALKSMSTDPLDRYATVKEMQAAIREYQSHLESVLLSTRADEDLKEATQSGDYQKFSRSLFGFQQAHELWSGNKRAMPGISSVKQSYAQTAMRKGDFDLGLSLLDEKAREHQSLRRDLLQAQHERVNRQKRLVFLKRAAMGLVAMVMLILVGASYLILGENQKARAAAIAEKKAADKAKEEQAKADEARKLADAARKTAERNEEIAVAAERRAEDARESAVDAKEKAIEAKESEEYEAYISKIGLASSQIDKNAFDAARRVLNECKPELRNWEWGRLMYLCSQDKQSFDATWPQEALAVDRDRNRFATGGWNATARIWDRTTGQVLHTLKHGGENVNSVAFSSNGLLLATGGNDPEGAIQIWDAATGNRIKVINAHTDNVDDEVLSVEFSQDGTRLLSSSYDNTARLWDVATGKELRKFVGHSWWVWSASFSHKEDRIVTASHDGTVIVWDVQTGKGMPAFTGHQGPVFSAVFSPDDKHVVSAGYDRRILAWSPDELKQADIRKLISSDDSTSSSTNFLAFEGHKDAVRSVEFSPDGTTLLSASFDNTVRVWSFETTEALQTFRGHGGRVNAALFIDDGRTLISASHDKTVREWSVADREEIVTLNGRALKGHSDAILSATYSHDKDHASQIVTSSRDRTARTWDAKTGKPLLTLDEGHSFLASNALFFPFGKHLLTAAVDNTARIWDVSSGGQLVRLDGCGRGAAAAISRDGRWIATGGDDKSAQLWDGRQLLDAAQLGQVKTGTPVKKLVGHTTEVTAVAFSPDNQIVATGDAKGHVKLWNVESGQLEAKLDGQTRRISAIAYIANGTRILTASSDNTVGQWDATTHTLLGDLFLKHPASVFTLRKIPGDRLIVTSCADKYLRIWDTETAKIVLEIGPFNSDVYSMDVSEDGKRLIAASSDERTVRLFDIETGREMTAQQRDGKLGALVDLKRQGGLLWSTAFVPNTEDILTIGGNDVRMWDRKSGRSKLSFNQHAAVASAQFSPNGKLIVTSSWDNSAKIWDVATGTVIHKLENEHTLNVNTAVFSPDGKYVLTASDDRTAKLWDIETGQVVGRFIGHEDRVRAAVFSPDGTCVATASSDRTIRLWDTMTQALVRKFEGHNYAVVSVEFSKDGRKIVTGSEDADAFVWNVETGERLNKLSGHTATVTSAAFSPDMQRIITGSQDQVAKLWDATSGKEILTLSRHTGEVTSVTFSPDGNQVLTGSRDGTAIIWQSLGEPGPKVASGK